MTESFLSQLCSRIMLLKGLLVIDEGPVFRVRAKIFVSTLSASSFCSDSLPSPRRFRVHLRAPATCNKAIDHTFTSGRKGSRAFSLLFYSRTNSLLQ
jgi:hypothetical protein